MSDHKLSRLHDLPSYHEVVFKEVGNLPIPKFV